MLMAALKVTTSGCNLENDMCSKRLNAINHCSPESGFLFDPYSIHFCLEAEWQVETMLLYRLIVNMHNPDLKHSFEGAGHSLHGYHGNPILRDLQRDGRCLG